jgi:hypothetical protein
LQIFLGVLNRFIGSVSQHFNQEQLSFATVKSGSEFPDIFPDTPGNPENPGKSPDIPPLKGGTNSTEIKLAQM